MSGAPRSFGRAREEEPVEKPAEVPSVQVPGGLRLVDGRLVLEVDLVPVMQDEVLQELYEQVRDVVALGVADGFAAATGQPKRDLDDLLPPSAGAAGGAGPVCVRCGESGEVTSAAEAGVEGLPAEAIVCTDTKSCVNRQVKLSVMKAEAGS